VKRARPVIAIDGPGGAGKSTVARKLAQELEMTYLNTGAMYRAVAVAIRDAGIKRDDPKLEQRIAPILKSSKIELDGDRVILNGRDISSLITENEINDLASVFSALPSVRARMRELQHAAGEQGGVVMEGRDIGTVVFPDAEYKFYLDADSAIRAERRYAELSRKDAGIKRDEVLRQLAERDHRDRMREIAPLKVADDAIVIDVSKMSVDEVVSALKERIQPVASAERA
jgi:cytidylate kinase